MQIENLNYMRFMIVSAVLLLVIHNTVVLASHHYCFIVKINVILVSSLII